MLYDFLFNFSFKLFFKRLQERLVPGFALEIKVIFKPEEYKYYNDAIRIFSEVSNTIYM